MTISPTQLAERIYNDMQALVTAHGPEALDLTLRAMQFEAIGIIVSRVVFLVATYFLIRFLLTRGYEFYEREVTDPGGFLTVCGALLGVAWILSALISIVALFSAQLWITAIDPRLGFALKIINSIGGTE